MTDFKKFDEIYDSKKIIADLREMKNTVKKIDFDNTPVPEGTYEITVTKLELGESKKGDVMVKMYLKILAGAYKGRLLFLNQVVTTPKQVNRMGKFLYKLGSNQDIRFDGYQEYSELLQRIFEDIHGVYDYIIEYTIDKGFPNYKILERDTHKDELLF